jgi:hypothetical protein
MSFTQSLKAFHSTMDITHQYLEVEMQTSHAIQQIITTMMMSQHFIQTIGELHTYLTNQPASYSPILQMLFTLHPTVNPFPLDTNGPWFTTANQNRNSNSPVPALMLFNHIWNIPHNIFRIWTQCASPSFLVSKRNTTMVVFRRHTLPQQGPTFLEIDIRYILLSMLLIDSQCTEAPALSIILLESPLDFVNIIEEFTAYCSRKPLPHMRTYFPVSSFTPSYAYDLVTGTSIHAGLLSIFYRFMTNLYRAATHMIIVSNTGYVMYDTFPFTCIPLCTHTSSYGSDTRSRCYISNFVFEIDVSYFRVYRLNSMRPPIHNVSSPSANSTDPLSSLSQELFDQIFLEIFSMSHSSQSSQKSTHTPDHNHFTDRSITFLVRRPRPPKKVVPTSNFDFGESLRIQVPVTVVFPIRGQHSQRDVTTQLTTHTNDFPTSIIHSDYHDFSPWLSQSSSPSRKAIPKCLQRPEFPSATPSLLKDLDSDREPPFNWCCNDDFDTTDPSFYKLHTPADRHIFKHDPSTDDPSVE